MSQDYPSVVNERWTRRYNIQLSQATPIDDIPQCVSTPTRRKKTLTQNEKFRKPNIVLQDIASKLAQCGMDTFERRLSALKIAKEYIENDKDFSVVKLRIVDTPEYMMTEEDPTLQEGIVMTDENAAEEDPTLQEGIVVTDENTAEEEHTQHEDELAKAHLPLKMKKHG